MKCNFKCANIRDEEDDKVYCLVGSSTVYAHPCDEEECILYQIREGINIMNVADTITKLNFAMEVIREFAKTKKTEIKHYGDDFDEAVYNAQVRNKLKEIKKGEKK